MRKAMMVLALALCATPAFAEDWQSAGTAGNGAAVFVDRDSIRADGTTRLLQIRIALATPMEGRTGGEFLVRVDCAQRTHVMLAFTMHSPGGGVESGQIPLDRQETQPITPNTPQEVMFNMACS